MSVEKSNTDYGERGTGGQIPEQREVGTSRGNENTSSEAQQIISDTRSQIDAAIPGILKKD